MPEDRVIAGQPVEPRAEAWNELIDVRDWWRRRGGPRGGAILPPPQTPQLDPSNIVWIKNNTGDDLRLGEIAELQTKLLTTVERYAGWFNADTPDLTNPFVICLEPIADGNIGPAAIDGICPALVTVGSTTDRWAYPASGSAVLASGHAGAVRLLYPPSGTGEVYCFVKFDRPAMYRGTSNSAIPKGTVPSDNKTVSRYLAGSTTDSGIDDVVANEMADITASGKVLYYCDDGGGTLYIIAAECPL